LPALFRLPSLIEPAADARLNQLGYAIEGETLTLRGELAPAGPRDPDIAIAARPQGSWLAAMAEWQGQTLEQAAVYRRVVESIAVPAGFASLREDGQWAALAYGAVYEGWLCCESVVAHPRLRGRGHARRLLTALLAWGAERGAQGVCLQVAADNAPALALYRSLGLRNELYRYHYRREPKAG
jgi:N-acetylglutamate synthase